VDDFAAFDARWKENARTTAQAVAAALPLFDRTMAAEAVHRSGIEDGAPAAYGEAERRALFRAALEVRSALEEPAPRIYWRGGQADTFSLCPLHHLTGCDEEVFDEVEAAVRVYVRRSLGQRRFDALYDPLEKALADARAHNERRTEVMLEELANESRADRYERWGPLLMASPGAVPRRTDRVELPDLFAAGEATTIPLDPLLDAVGNAQRYYDKARTTRQARAHAEERLVASEQRSEEAAALLETLRGLATVRDVERFKKEEAERLAKYLGQRADTEDRIPFRRYELAGGYEVWVGRNARQNDHLTFQHARKYDLWMHARGTPGSHTVLRLPARTAEPPPALLERAAAIAAYHSKARGSSLVPVIVVPRKYVRKPRGAAPGAVVVEREQVLLVAPELPE
jgi:predicted ribosome quality control (RQC) complex YloA/Tae2 family protein